MHFLNIYDNNTKDSWGATTPQNIINIYRKSDINNIKNKKI